MNIKVIVCLGLLCMLSLFSCKQKTVDNLTPQEKLAVLDAKIKKEPQAANLYISRARVYLEMERLNDALSDCGKAVSIDPDNAEYYLLMSDLYFLKGNMEMSYENIQKSIQFNPKSADAYLRLSELSLYNKDYKRSLESIEKSLEFNKINPSAIFLRGYVQKEMGDTFAAVDSYKKVIEYDPGYEAAFEELGLLYGIKKDPLTVEYLNTAIELNPNNVHAMYALAMYYQEKEDIDEAMALYENILSVMPNHIDALNNLGFIYQEYYQNHTKALTFFDKALEEYPDFVQALYNRGCAYEALNENSKALVDFEKITILDPENKNAEGKIVSLSRLLEK